MNEREPQRIDGGWLVKTVGAYDIQVIKLSSCARVVAQHHDDPPRTPSAYWCYYGPAKTTAAILAALAWDGALDTEPAGASRSFDDRSRSHPRR